jgi:hypothetical protein
MGATNHNSMLAAALALMETAVPGMFEDPEAAWRACVASLRYVVIRRAENPSISQLKTVQAFSGSFYECTAKNLVEVRAALKAGELRLEAIPLINAEANIGVLGSVGLEACLAELSDDERHERLRILELLPPAGEP